MSEEKLEEIVDIEDGDLTEMFNYLSDSSMELAKVKEVDEENSINHSESWNTDTGGTAFA